MQLRKTAKAMRCQAQQCPLWEFPEVETGSGGEVGNELSPFGTLNNFCQQEFGKTLFTSLDPLFPKVTKIFAIN